MKGLYITLLFALPLCLSAAQAYKIVRPDGTVEFSDQPSKNAEIVNLPEAQQYQSTGISSTPAQSSTTTPGQHDEAGDYQQFSIVSPAAEATVPHNGGAVSVSVGVSPALRQGDLVVITLDGSEVARGPSTSFTLSGVTRGAHQVAASIVDSTGTMVLQASPITFYLFQPSLKNPNRQ